jgi:hypothetical protein
LRVKIAASSRLEGRQAHCRRILAANSAQHDCCDEKQEHEGKDLGSKNVLKSVTESCFKCTRRAGVVNNVRDADENLPGEN